MNHIVLIGFVGSGKTRVGKSLAKELGLDFIDVDRVITKRMNLTIKEIYGKFGEPFYRALETTTIKALIQDNERKVISLGSGLPVQEQNKEYIKKLGTVVYIKGEADVLFKRMANSGSAPADAEQEAKLRKLLKQRDPIYAGFADIQVVTGVKAFEELVEEIKQKVEAYKKNS